MNNTLLDYIVNTIIVLAVFGIAVDFFRFSFTKPNEVTLHVVVTTDEEEEEDDDES